jgi:hypothetical protein
MMRRRTYPRHSFDGVTWSEIRKAAARAWSAITRIETSSASRTPYALPARRSTWPISGRIRSVRKFEGTPWTTAAIRSSPIPVSIEGLGSGVSRPSALRSNCMKTRFQISSQRSHSHAGP